MSKKITIIGSGALASALGLVLSDMKFNNICIYGIDQDELKDLRAGYNTKYFAKQVQLPKFKTTSNLQKAIGGANYIIIAVPSKVIGNVFPKIIKLVNSEVLIINGSKGFYPQTNVLIHSGLEQVVEHNRYVRGVVSITGPSHAEEIVLRYPTLVTIIGNDAKLNLEVHQLFKTKNFKCYIQNDVIGAEVGATYKNVLAIASGLAEGMGYGVNTRAALISRGLLEMSRFSSFMNGQPLTVYGLSGLGDLIVTATSDLSRNFKYGKMLPTLKNRLDPQFTVEGLTALKYIYRIGYENKLDLPIAYSLYNFIFNKASLKAEIAKMWNSQKVYE